MLDVDTDVAVGAVIAAMTFGEEIYVAWIELMYDCIEFRAFYRNEHGGVSDTANVIPPSINAPNSQDDSGHGNESVAKKSGKILCIFIAARFHLVLRVVALRE